MGATSSIHPEVIKSIEVSFVDETGKLKSYEEIKYISAKACKDFDFKPSFYDGFKVDKYGKNPYEQYSIKLKNGLIK